MFKMVPEEITAQHGKKMIIRLGTGIVRPHLLGVRIPMGPVRTEIEELEGAQERRHDPEYEQILNRDLKQVQPDIEQQCHGHDLSGGNVVEEKVKKPDDWILVLHTEIWIIDGPRVPMVSHMLVKQALIGEGSEQPQGNSADHPVEMSVETDCPVHAVVSGDEQTGIQIHLDKHMQPGHPRVP
jgi:hypothetical protein